MAKRKNKLLLSDLFPELAAEREVAEEEEREREREREREEPARKVQKMSKKMEPIGLKDMTKRGEVERPSGGVQGMEADEGAVSEGNKKDKEETSLYKWLQDCKPGGEAGPRLAGRS
jgi:hypothetical protein